MRLKDYEQRDLKFQKSMFGKSVDDPVMIGEHGGVSREFWKLIVEAAPGSKGPIYYRGVEIAVKPVHRHCSAEGI